MTEEKTKSDKIIISSICFNFIIIILWIFYSCVYPPVYFIGNYFVYIGLFWFTMLFWQNFIKLRYIYIPFIFSLMLINDFMLRSYGSGHHDQVGKALCDITFIASFICISLCMLIYSVISHYKMLTLDTKFNKKSFFKEILYIIFNILIFFSIFLSFNMDI